MGTLVEVGLSGADDPSIASDACEAVFAEFARLESLLSEWRPESELGRVNAAAGDAPVDVSPEVFLVTQRALRVADLTDGAFDPTFAALWGLWTFGADGISKRPSPDAVEARRLLIDWRKVRLDAERSTVFLPERGMKLGLGGIAKGYATDRAAAILRDRGFRDFSLKAGGDLFVSGRRGSRPWRIGLRDPRGPDAFAAIDLEDSAFGTSGDYERFFFDGGVRWHHIIDPATGYPARRSRSATVLAADALTADALDTALFVMGPARGIALAESLPGIEAAIVGSDGRLYLTTGLAGRLDVFFPPANAP